MGRGKALRSKVKQTKALTKAELQARKEWEERSSNFLYNLKQRLTGMLKNIDPLELAAVGGLTIFLQPIIATSSEIMQAVVRVTEHGVSAIEGFKVIWEWMGLIPKEEEQKEILGVDLLSWVLAFVVAFIMVRHPDMVIGSLTSISKLALGLIA